MRYDGLMGLLAELDIDIVAHRGPRESGWPALELTHVCDRWALIGAFRPFGDTTCFFVAHELSHAVLADEAKLTERGFGFGPIPVGDVLTAEASAAEAPVIALQMNLMNHLGCPWSMENLERVLGREIDLGSLMGRAEADPIRAVLELKRRLALGHGAQPDADALRAARADLQDARVPVPDGLRAVLKRPFCWLALTVDGWQRFDTCWPGWRKVRRDSLVA